MTKKSLKTHHQKLDEYWNLQTELKALSDLYGFAGASVELPELKAALRQAEKFLTQSRKQLGGKS